MYTFDDDFLEYQSVFYRIKNDPTNPYNYVSGIVETCEGRVDIFFKTCDPNSSVFPCTEDAHWFPSLTNNDRQEQQGMDSPYIKPIGVCSGDISRKCSTQQTYYIGIYPKTAHSSIVVRLSGHKTEGPIGMQNTGISSTEFNLESKKAIFATPTYCASYDSEGNCIVQPVPSPSYTFCVAAENNPRLVNIASVCGCTRARHMNHQDCIDGGFNTTCTLGKKIGTLSLGEHYMNVMLNREDGDVIDLPAFTYTPSRIFVVDAGSNVVLIIMLLAIGFMGLMILGGASTLAFFFFRKKLQYQSL